MEGFETRTDRILTDGLGTKDPIALDWSHTKTNRIRLDRIGSMMCSVYGNIFGMLYVYRNTSIEQLHI